MPITFQTDQKGTEASFHFPHVRENSPAWLEGFICLTFLYHKEQTPQHCSNLFTCSVCVCMLVYTHSVRSSNSANNTLYLIKAGSRENTQWFMGKQSQCFPIPFSCLFV